MKKEHPGKNWKTGCSASDTGIVSDGFRSGHSVQCQLI